MLSFNNAVADGGLSDVRKLLAGYERLVVLCLPVERAVAVSAPLSAFTASALNLVMGIWAEGTGVDLRAPMGQAAQCFHRAEEPALKAVAMTKAALYQTELLYCTVGMKVEIVEVTELSAAEELSANGVTTV